MNPPVIHPTAFVAPTAVVMGDVTVGADSSIWYTAVLRADSAAILIGNQTNLQDGTIVHVDEGVPCRVGDRVGVGHRVILHGCVVEDECLIGMGSILMNGVVIGRGSLVAAGSLVTEGTRVPPGSLVVGSPGRVLRTIDSALTEKISQTWRHYVTQAKRHREGQFPLVKV